MGVFKMVGIIGSYRLNVVLEDKAEVLATRGSSLDHLIKANDVKVCCPYDFQEFWTGPSSIALLDGELYTDKGVISAGKGAEALLDIIKKNELNSVNGMFAFVAFDGKDLYMARDPLGVKPLYYLKNGGGILFASEAKALTFFKGTIKEFPPGYYYTSKKGFTKYFELPTEKVEIKSKDAAKKLREHLDSAVKIRMHPEIGAWLSGGLDSSVISAIASKYKNGLHTFFAGTKNSSDRPYAQIVAKHLNTKHHERILKPKEIVNALSEVVYRLENFDAFLVRSSVLNYFAAKTASDYVPVSFTGKGSDELFGGYNYLTSIKDLDSELVKITSALHDTAFQRVDRMSSAHRLKVKVPFADIDLVNYAFSIPSGIKVFNGTKHGKWLLREAAKDLLPEEVIYRSKIKFWQGGGIIDILSKHAEKKISDSEFKKANSNKSMSFKNKEDYLNYKILSSQFPNKSFIEKLGRTENP